MSTLLYRAVLVFALSSGIALGDELRSIESPERTYGLFIGDVVQQRIEVLDDEELQDWSGRLPEGRVGPWLERLPLTMDLDEQGGRWILLSYQVVNAPEALTEASLPPIPNLPDTTSNVAISIGPLTPLAVSENGSLGNMQLDGRDEPSHIEPLWRRAWILLGALIATLLAWVLWWLWRTRSDRVRLPFAHAKAQLSKLSPSEDDAQAWRLAHDALNRTAGRSMSANTVPELIDTAPWLSTFDNRLNAFYNASDARFFEVPPVVDDFPVHDFVRDLAQAERRHVS